MEGQSERMRTSLHTSSAKIHSRSRWRSCHLRAATLLCTARSGLRKPSVHPLISGGLLIDCGIKLHLQALGAFPHKVITPHIEILKGMPKHTNGDKRSMMTDGIPTALHVP